MRQRKAVRGSGPAEVAMETDIAATAGDSRGMGRQRQESAAPVTVSVIMGVYNQHDRETLHYAVDSILNQSFRDFEFIIYDDGSDPEAGKLIKELEGLDPRIILIGRGQNHGLAFSLNSCISRARGRYIARMDADDYSHPDRLQVQLDFMDAHPDVAWCGCNVRLFDAGGVWGSRQMPETPDKRDYLRFSPFVHPTVMYRSSVIRDERYLESKETLRCEDYEIFMRLTRKGLIGKNIQQELFDYREDKDSFQRRKLRYRLNEAKVRCRNFRELGILFPTGWLYVVRPVVGAVLPNSLLRWLKKKESDSR